MTAELELTESETGWILYDEIIMKCAHCSKKINPPFFLCTEYNLGFCEDCETSNPGRLCMSRTEEHIHFNIIELKHETKTRQVAGRSISD